MQKFSFSLIGSFLLLYIQSLIVMKVFHYQTIYFEHLGQVLMVCAINFFLVYSILSQLSPWLVKIKFIETEQDR